MSSSCWVNNILRQKYSNDTSEGAQTARRKEPSYITQREPKRTTRSFGSSSLASTAARVRNKFSDQEGRSNEIILLLTITGAFVRLSPYAPALMPHERTSVKLRSRRDSIYREGKPLPCPEVPTRGLSILSTGASQEKSFPGTRYNNDWTEGNLSFVHSRNDYAQEKGIEGVKAPRVGCISGKSAVLEEVAIYTYLRCTFIYL